MRRFPLAALAVLSLAAPCRAENAPTPDNTEWTAVDVSTAGSGAPSSPSTGTATGDFSWKEQFQFFEDLNKNIIDQICRNIDVNASQSFPIGEAGSVSVGIRRRLAMLPNRHIAIVDQKNLSLSAGHAFPLGETGDAAYSFWAGGRVQGTSYVVRETSATKSCDEVLQLLNLPSYAKQTVVFPIKAKALMGMKVGEMWKIPMIFSMGGSFSGGLPVGVVPVPGSVSISLGGGQDGSSIMTVYRYLEGKNEKIRFRLRIDHAWVLNRGGSVVAGYKIGELFALGSGLIHEGFSQLDHLIVREIENFLTASIGYSVQTSDGQELVIEFILDPDNAEQMEKLALVMNGDFWTLAKMASAMLLHIDTPAHSIKEYVALAEKNKKTLGVPASLTAVDKYHRKNHSFPINLPFLFRRVAGSSFANDHIEFKDAVSAFNKAPGGYFHLAQADKSKSTAYGNLPGPVGSLIKRAAFRSAQAFYHADKDGAESDPQAVYIQQEGFVRRSSGKARLMAERVNRIMTLSGVRGGAPNPRYEMPLDLDRIQPQQKPAPGIAPLPEPPATLHDGMVALTIVFTEKAVRDMLGSAPELVVRCFVNTLENLERRVMDWILDHGTMDSEGRLSYDEEALFATFHLSKDDYNWPKFLCRTAARIVADIAAAREAPDKPARLQALIDLMAGRGKSGLAYDQIMRVLVQLVDPMDITADLVLNVTKGKKLAGIRSRFALTKGRAPNPLLEAAGKAKSLVAHPSVLVD